MQSQHSGHRQRLRARYDATGFDGFAPHEALELLLSYAIPRRDTNAIAHDLLNKYGTLHKVLEAPLQDICQVAGVGQHAACLISMMLPLMRLYAQSKAGEKAQLNSAMACKAYARGLLMGERFEHVEVIALDSKACVIATQRVASGDEGEALVSARKVMAFLLRCGASQAVLAHNHPDGTLAASDGDRALTKALGDIMQALGVVLLDHIIVGGMQAYSFREQGLLENLAAYPAGKE